MEKDNIIFNYYEKQKERLKALRELVKLNPIDYLRVSNAIKQEDKVREINEKYNESDKIDMEFSVANDLEYTLRLNAFMKKYYEIFYAYQKSENDQYGLEDFALDFVDKYIQDNYNNKRKVK